MGARFFDGADDAGALDGFEMLDLIHHLGMAVQRHRYFFHRHRPDFNQLGEKLDPAKHFARLRPGMG